MEKQAVQMQVGSKPSNLRRLRNLMLETTTGLSARVNLFMTY